LPGGIEEDGRACVVGQTSGTPSKRPGHTMPAMEKELRAKLYFLDWAPMLFTSALSGQRVGASLPLALLAVEQHRRRVTTSVRERSAAGGAELALSPHQRGRGARDASTTATQVPPGPPSFTLFVNDPKAVR